VPAEQGLKDRRVGLTAAEHVSAAPEDGFDQLGVGDVDQVHAEWQAHGEHVTIGP
jgi:hypothetical protein